MKMLLGLWRESLTAYLSSSKRFLHIVQPLNGNDFASGLEDLKRYLREKRGAPFVAAFTVLLVVSPLRLDSQNINVFTGREYRHSYDA
jgi:hypothetical protein